MSGNKKNYKLRAFKEQGFNKCNSIKIGMYSDVTFVQCIIIKLSFHYMTW